jgi:hypothetical protein
VGFFAKLFQRFPCRFYLFSRGYEARKGFFASRGGFQIFEGSVRARDDRDPGGTSNLGNRGAYAPNAVGARFYRGAALRHWGDSEAAGFREKRKNNRNEAKTKRKSFASEIVCSVK